jgi:hypothetical protein
LLAPEEIEEIINRDESAAEQDTADDDVSATKKTKASRKPVKTTSQAAKKERGRKMKAGVHVKIQQKCLYPICSCDEQRDSLPSDDPDCAFYYGIITGGTLQKGNSVQFDILPEACDTIDKVRRVTLFIVEENADEPLSTPSCRPCLTPKSAPSKKRVNHQRQRMRMHLLSRTQMS